MPEDVMVSTDIGNINSVANSYLRFEKPRSFFAAMSFGNCGYVPDDHRREGGRTAPSGRVVCGRRRLGHELDGNDDLRAPQHSRDGRGVPQPPVGRGKEKPGGFLQPPLRRRRTDNQSFAEIARAMGAEGITVDKLEDVGPA
jgi:sulfoacetaldehyde acetyltransferase